MNKLLLAGLISLSFAQASALSPQAQAELQRKEAAIKAKEEKVKQLHREIARDKEEHARHQSAAHVEYDSQQKKSSRE